MMMGNSGKGKALWLLLVWAARRVYEVCETECRDVRLL